MSDEVEGVKQRFLETGTGFSEQVLLELIWLVKLVLSQRDDSASAYDRLSTKVDGLRAELVQMESRIMDELKVLTAKVTELQAENAEIQDFITTKAGELAAAKTEIERLLALIATLEPNQITPEIRAQVTAAVAGVQTVIDGLNTHTPPAPPVEPVPEGRRR